MLASTKSTRLLGVLIGLLALACTPTTQGEQARWERNVGRGATLKAKYPAAASAIDEAERTARSAFDSARGLSGEAAAQGMASANLSYERLLNPIEDFDRTMEQAKLLQMQVPAAAGDLMMAMTTAQSTVMGASGRSPTEVASIFDAAEISLDSRVDAAERMRAAGGTAVGAGVPMAPGVGVPMAPGAGVPVAPGMVPGAAPGSGVPAAPGMAPGMAPGSGVPGAPVAPGGTPIGGQ